MKFRSYLLASIGVSLSTAALAADLPTRKEAPPPVPYVAPFTWTGFYIGAFAGGSFGSPRITKSLKVRPMGPSPRSDRWRTSWGSGDTWGYGDYSTPVN